MTASLGGTLMPYWDLSIPGSFNIIPSGIGYSLDLVALDWNPNTEM